MAFTDRLLRRRKPLDNIIGFAGGTLEDQLNRDDQQQRPSILTPQNQQVITRPREVNPQPPAPDQSTRPRSVANPFLDRLLSDPSRQERPREVEPTDDVTKDVDYLRQMQDRPLSWRDKAGLVAQNIATNLGGKPLPTRRQRDLARAGGQLEQDLGVAKTQAAIDQSRMVPVTLANGQQVMVPARTAGSVSSQQQGYSARRQQIEDHRKRWEQMGSHEAAQDAQRLFNSGAADDNDDLKDEIAKRMGLPAGTRLPNHDRGQVQVDDQGNFILINPKSGDVKPALRPQDGGPPQPVGSMQNTMEKGRERRFNTAQTNANTRAANVQAGADRRAGQRGTTATTDRAAVRRAAELVGKIESARQAIAAADERLKKEPNNSTAKRTREEARIAGEGWATELNALNAGYEAGAGTQGYPYYKKSDGQQQSAPSVGTAMGGSFNLAGWKASHPDATKEQIDAVRQKAKARNLAIVE